MHKYRGSAKNRPINTDPFKTKSLVTKSVEAVILVTGLVAAWAIIVITLCL